MTFASPIDASWRQDLYWRVAVRSALEVAGIGFLYFFLCGTSLNQSEFFLRMFVLLYVPVAVVTVSIEAIHEARNRLVGDEPADAADHRALGKPHARADAWGSILPRAMLLSLLAVAGLFAGFEFVASAPPSPLFTICATLLAVALAALVLARVASTRYLSHFLEPDHGEPPLQDGRKKHDSDARLVTSYLLPWPIIAAVLCGLLSSKYFSGSAHGSASGIALIDAAFSAGGTAYVVALWVCFAARTQAVSDLRLGLLDVPESDRIAGGDILFLIHLGAAIVVGAMILLGRVLSIESLTVTQIVTVETLTGAGAAAGGALLGVLYQSMKRSAVPPT